jgi:hypothetical protein
MKNMLWEIEIYNEMAREMKWNICKYEEALKCIMWEMKI